MPCTDSKLGCRRAAKGEHGRGADLSLDYADYERLRFDRPHSRVLRVTMDQGKMNAADHVLHRELGEVWRQIDRDPSVNAAILTGAGKHFSAGGDFALIEDMIADFEVRTRV